MRGILKRKFLEAALVMERGCVSETSRSMDRTSRAGEIFTRFDSFTLLRLAFSTAALHC
jgi:hypothetical protein